MEDKIKNFDRSIEQKMNESAVPPPFGMWNRISAELDAVPTAAPASTGFPKSAIIGIVLGVVILGGVLTASWFTREQAKEQIPAQVNIATSTAAQMAEVAATPTVSIASTEAITPVNEEATPVMAHKSIAKHRIVSKPVEENTSIAKEETTPAVATTDASLMTANTNSEAAAPVQNALTGIGSVNEPYYFPPVDRIVSEKNSDKSFSSSASSKIASNGDENDDKKLEPAKEQKIHFKPHKKHKWGYGKIIRTK